MIRFEAVTFGYQKRVILEDINLEIAQGECVLLCGKSGSGKTTLTKLMNGLIPHFTEDIQCQGQIVVYDRDVFNTTCYELSKVVGSVFQNPKSQFFYLNSDAELAFGLENHGYGRREISKRVDKVTQSMSIQYLRNRKVHQLSAGEKQSLAFASIYSMSPKVYVLDEPTANLDQKGIDTLKSQLDALRKSGHTLIIAEHRLYYLSDIVDRVVYVGDSKISNYTWQSLSDLPYIHRQKMGLRTLTKKNIELEKCTSEFGDYEVKNLSYSIGHKKILDDVSFGVQRGEILGITGSNGRGKSTLLRILMGLVKPSQGEIKLDQCEMNGKSRLKSSFMVMQDVNHQLFSDSVIEECRLSCSDEKKIDKYLKILNLYAYRDVHPMTLSGGQKQRLAVATGIMCDKDILLFDEPTSGLDYTHMVHVSHLIREVAEQGHIMIVVSHDIEFLNLCCDKVLNL